MITRRVLRRTHLLRPDADITALYLYSLGVFAERYGLRVVCAVVMSNHYHLIITDSRGTLPDFKRDFHRTLALGVKQLRTWEGAVWDSDKSSVVELRTEQAVIEAIGYCCGNPTEAGAVRRARQWPGFIVLPEQLGRASWTVKRPDLYFDEDNTDWPEVTTLRLSMPPIAMTAARIRECVASELERIETAAQLAAQEHGRRFLGRDKVLASSPYSRATSFEPIRHRNPTFAVGRGQREAFFQAVTELREFRRAYREALRAWRIGLRNVIFPAGTWLMRCVHGALTAPS
jgi:putative transposase